MSLGGVRDLSIIATPPAARHPIKTFVNQWNDVLIREACQREINRGCEGIKPGWVRVNFNYFIDEATFDYIVEAVHMIASHGASLLGEYDFEPDSGLWHHRRGSRGPSMSLAEISYAQGRMDYVDRRRQETIDLDRHLAAAHELFHAARTARADATDHPTTNPDFEHLRWFPYADEIVH